MRKKAPASSGAYIRKRKRAVSISGIVETLSRRCAVNLEGAGRAIRP
jgi:hypothetical protein